MHHPCRSPLFCTETAQGHVPFSDVFVPDLVLGCGVEWASAEGRVAVGAGIEVAVL